MVSTITLLIIAGILGGIGTMIPEFIVPAIIVAASPLFLGIFNNKKKNDNDNIEKINRQQINENIIEQPPKKRLFSFITKRLGFSKHKDNNNNNNNNNNYDYTEN